MLVGDISTYNPIFIFTTLLSPVGDMFNYNPIFIPITLLQPGGAMFTYNPIFMLITLVIFRCEFSFITYTLNIPLIPLIPLFYEN